MEQNGLKELKGEKSLLLGVRSDGTGFLMASHLPRERTFQDKEVLDTLVSGLERDIHEGSVNYRFLDRNYFGVYEYSPKWEAFLEGLTRTYQVPVIVSNYIRAKRRNPRMITSFWNSTRSR